jgi:hypothetical protein
MEALQDVIDELFVLDDALKAQGEEGVIAWQTKW